MKRKGDLFMSIEAWRTFKGQEWKEEINVSSFIKDNYSEYLGDDGFLEGISEKSKRVWNKCVKLFVKENKKGILGVELKTMSGINSFKPGYINKSDNVIVGLQTDKPLKRIVNPYGGMRMVNNSLEAYKLKLNKHFTRAFSEFRKTHNDGVYDAYTPSIRAARSSGLITGLPDSYGRGRIIGDYRRIALYGIDYLVEEKRKDLLNIREITEETIRLREEVNEQIKALGLIKEMAKSYGFDISRPASNAKEATQWLYFGYLAAVKENNGAAMSLGRTATFLDIYIERDLKEGTLTEKDAQEIIDQFIIKLRLVRHLRTPGYDEIFAGDPTWVTEAIGGMLDENRSLVTKNSFRYLHTLYTLGSSPEPNLTVLWSNNLPENFKKFCAKVSVDTDAIQYENDDIMRPLYGDDYAIACCVSAMNVGKTMQFFGARCNLVKSLLYSLNGGIDEILNIKVLDGIDKNLDEILDYEKVKTQYFNTLSKVAELYANTMNIIHYMHDKYAYEAGQMSLHDTNVERLMAFGVAGLSVAADSLSAIKYAKVKPIRDENNIIVDFVIEGDFPKYGNDDDNVDNIAKEILEYFYKELCKYPLYRNAKHTLSVLTITSNVVYGNKTGATPDGRKKGVPFAPGANPMHGRDVNGAIASLNSVSKINYKDCCRDGVSNTFSTTPNVLGNDYETRINNLVNLLDGYFIKGGHHLNVNVLSRETLIDAMNNPEKYPLLTIRVSGYAVRFNRLTKTQQQEVISRTFHEKL